MAGIMQPTTQARSRIQGRLAAARLPDEADHLDPVGIAEARELNNSVCAAPSWACALQRMIQRTGRKTFRGCCADRPPFDSSQYLRVVLAVIGTCC
jgi:hypothetical protein